MQNDVRLEIVFFENGEIVFLVELVDQRLARRDFHRDDFLSGEVFQFHHQGAQAVAMGGDEDFAAGFERRGDLVIELRFDTVGRINQAFRERKIRSLHLAFFDQILIKLLIARETGIIGSELRRLNVGRTTPDVHLFIAPLHSGFGFVEALESAIMPLIETPRIMFFDFAFAQFGEHDIHRAIGPRKHRAESDVEAIAVFLERLARFVGLFDAIL